MKSREAGGRSMREVIGARARSMRGRAAMIRHEQGRGSGWEDHWSSP